MKTETNKLSIAIGNKLREKRMKAGMSQKEFGKKLNVTFQQVQKYEKGINRISSNKLYIASKVLGFDIGKFFESIDINEDIEPLTLDIRICKIFRRLTKIDSKYLIIVDTFIRSLIMLEKSK